MSNFLDLAKKACEAAIAAGADQADVAIHEWRRAGVEIEKSQINACESSQSQGLSVRAYKRGGMGFASANTWAEEEILAVAREAASLAAIAHPDPDFKSLPEPAEGTPVAGLYDPKIADLTVEQAVEWGITGIETAQQVAPEAIVNGGSSIAVGRNGIVNSLGVAVESESTWANMYIFAVIKKSSDDVGSYYEFDFGHRLRDFEPEPIGERAAREAMRFLGARTIKSGMMPIVMGPFAAMGLLGSTCGAAEAEGVQRGRSFLGGKRGEQIASELITIRDCPFYRAGGGSSSYDGEGVPHRPLTLIEEGVLKSYLHNSYTANKAGEENTAHSARMGISPTNLIPELGDWDSAEIIEDTKDGLYVNAGGLHPQSITGEISGTIDFGFRIENGEQVYPVKTTLVGAHIFDLLQSIDAVSRDFRSEPGSVMPTIRAQNVRVAGGK